MEHDNVTLVDELDSITKEKNESLEQVLSLQSELSRLKEELSISKTACNELTQNVFIVILYSSMKT